MSTEAKIKAIAPWFGGKRTLAPVIVEELGPHRAYWEPFCGGLPVLLAKEPSTFETVSDLFGDLMNLANVLRSESHAVELYGRLSRMLMHEDIFHQAAESWHRRGYQSAPEEPSVERAWEFFVCSWMGRNGVSGTSSYNQGFCVRYTKNTGHAATRFLSAVESIPAWHHRLRAVTILSRCAFGLLDRIEDAEGVVIYVDPPYLIKGARYIFDDDRRPEGVASVEWVAAVEWAWRNPTDDLKPERIAWHKCLASRLSRFKKTRVVLSYYQHPLLRVLYPGWTLRDTPTTKAKVNQGMYHQKGGVEAPEVLLMNGPSLARKEQS